MAKTFIKQRPIPGGGSGEVTVDDAFVATLEFENGAMGTLEVIALLRRAEEPPGAGDQRLEGQPGLQPRAPERAGRVLERRATPRDAGLPQRAGQRSPTIPSGRTGGRRAT